MAKTLDAPATFRFKAEPRIQTNNSLIARTEPQTHRSAGHDTGDRFEPTPSAPRADATTSLGPRDSRLDEGGLRAGGLDHGLDARSSGLPPGGVSDPMAGLDDASAHLLGSSGVDANLGAPEQANVGPDWADASLSLDSHSAFAGRQPKHGGTGHREGGGRPEGGGSHSSVAFGPRGATEGEPGLPGMGSPGQDGGPPPNNMTSNGGAENLMNGPGIGVETSGGIRLRFGSDRGVEVGIYHDFRINVETGDPSSAGTQFNLNAGGSGEIYPGRGEFNVGGGATVKNPDGSSSSTGKHSISIFPGKDSKNEKERGPNHTVTVQDHDKKRGGEKTVEVKVEHDPKPNEGGSTTPSSDSSGTTSSSGSSSATPPPSSGQQDTTLPDPNYFDPRNITGLNAVIIERKLRGHDQMGIVSRYADIEDYSDTDARRRGPAGGLVIPDENTAPEPTAEQVERVNRFDPTRGPNEIVSYPRPDDMRTANSNAGFTSTAGRRFKLG